MTHGVVAALRDRPLDGLKTLDYGPRLPPPPACFALKNGTKRSSP